MQYLDGTSNTTSLTTTDFKNFFQGTEIVVAGQILNNTVTRFVSNITGQNANGFINYDMDFHMIEMGSSTPETAGLRHFTERLWAYLTISDLLKKSSASINKTETNLMKRRALQLSLKVCNHLLMLTMRNNVLITVANCNNELIGLLKAATLNSSDYWDRWWNLASYTLLHPFNGHNSLHIFNLIILRCIP